MRNIYNKFRSIEKLASQYTLSKRFDEPTYFSFRLLFSDNYDYPYNVADNTALYDIMPHPLFSLSEVTIPVISPLNIPTNVQITNKPTVYSTFRYLENANEPTRAQMLKEFIAKFNDLQTNYPYYFQSIDGISDLLKVDSTKGQRITNDKKITVTCLEGIDLRMSYLMNLYKKIVWDDVYQRWVVPDMMKYFTLKVYLTEFRTFHLPEIQGKSYPYGIEANVPENAPLYLDILDDVLPTWEITCEMCEFDISDVTYDHLTNLNVASEPTQGAVKFGIKIGNIKELQVYPIFQHMFLSDRKLNGINRSKDEISTARESNSNIYPTVLQIGQTREAGNEDNRHISGYPYNERTNQNNINEADVEQERIPGSTLDVNFKPAQPETWVGNAINTGTALLDNTINKFIDKAKVTPIPNLGFSFNEVKTAIESKDIISALGLIRKSITTVANQYTMPSERLSGDITEATFTEFLNALTRSEATDDTTIKLQAAANVALSDRGIWEKIRDYSLATDLVSREKGEVNIPKTIDKNTGKSMIAEKSKATSGTLEVGTIIESAPTSRATTNKL